MFSALIKVVRWTGNKKTRIFFGFAYSFLISLVSAAPIAIAAWAMCGFLGLSNGEKPDLKIALTAGLAIIASIALRAALMWLRARAEETVAAERSNEVRVRIGEALKRVPLGYFDNHPSGEILSALTTELSFVEIHGMRMVDMLGNGYITAAAMVAFLAFMDLRACTLALAAVAVDTILPVEQKVNMFRESAAWLQEGKYDKEKVYQHAVVAMNQRDAGVTMGEWLVQFLQEFKFPESQLAVPALAIFRENPNDERAIMQLLRDAVNRNDTDQLDTICQRGRELHPDNELFYYFGAIAAYNREDDACAMEILEDGVKVMSNNTDSSVASQIYYMLGDAYIQKKLVKRAFAAYDSSLVKDPNNVQTLNNYAYHLSTRGVQLQRAVKLAQRATEIEPHNTIYLDTYAWALYKAGKYAEAKAVTDSMWVAFEKEGQSEKPDAGYYDRAGDIYFKAGAPKDAARMWKEALQLTSDHKEQRKLRAKLQKVR